MAEEVTQFPTTEEANDILSPEPTEDPINILETDEERAIAARIMPLLAAKANALAEANKTKELQEVVDNLRATNEKMIQDKLAEITKAAQPLNPDEVQKLISQEYLEIKIKIREGRAKREREFVLTELPQAIEQRMLTKISKGIVPHLKELTSADWTGSASMADRLAKIVEMMPGALDLLAEIAALALDPWGEEKVDAAWVSNNLSSKRIMDIIEGQISVGRFRDFFSAASRLFPTMR